VNVRIAPDPARNASGRSLSLADLTVCVDKGAAIVDGVSLVLPQGEILGLVGESGSGKTTTALALLGYNSPGTKITEGTLEIVGIPTRMDDSMRARRGAVISYVPQDPGRSLNPSLRIGAAIEDILRAHKRAGERKEVVKLLIDSVGLASSSEFLKRFPHQLSGGQQQRVTIALALSCEPAVVVLDEPTTGLDVVTQARILDLLRQLRDELKLSIVYVTHDLAVVKHIADRVAVMYAGRIVEEGPIDAVLRQPRHPYTRGLLASIPDHVRPHALEPMPGIAVGVGERPSGCSFAPRCPQRTDRCSAELPPLGQVEAHRLVRCFHWQQTPAVETTSLKALTRKPAAKETPLLRLDGLSVEHRSRRQVVIAAADIGFVVQRGTCVALVGESGSGKTTIARAIVGLHPPTSGQILLDGQPLPGSVRHRTIDQRRAIQFVAQNPADALNPRHTIRETISRPAHVLRGMRGESLAAEVDRLLEAVRLPSAVATRFPGELSGGERQRVAIARALAASPELVVCDEITSALDVSVQAAVLKLLNELRESLGLSLLFISHDLGVVATVADETIVLENGIICEQGPTDAVLRTPQHSYTQRLLAAAPSVAEGKQHDATKKAQ
jgi:peptide/nickel transport system ATP-binding protein